MPYVIECDPQNTTRLFSRTVISYFIMHHFPEFYILCISTGTDPNATKEISAMYDTFH